ncbi:hypothetical protein SCP_0803570 [Sparassis crispa]|uniref:Uncharacterized protein n=1 Tax=Sparassis crispa TaxID=139825 RepID=A0A401GUC2_9APHY|nr:hypothetical protein SCP_0803570 [Sparassis crispa]GBE85835.1 hypothetical protein SCP_0803570 [Sparassis crispa]
MENIRNQLAQRTHIPGLTSYRSQSPLSTSLQPPFFMSSSTGAATPNDGANPAKKSKAAIIAQLAEHEVRLEQMMGDLKALQKEFSDEEDSRRNGDTSALKQLVEHDTRLKSLDARIAELEQERSDILARAEKSDGSDSGLNDSLGSEDEKKVAAKESAYRDTSFKELVRHAFQLRLGIPNLLAKTLPWNNEGDEIPIESSTNKQYIRFRWEERWDSKANYPVIQELTAYVQKHGADLVPAAATALRALGERDIQERVAEKYKALQKGLRNAGILDAQGHRVTKKEEPTDDAGGIQGIGDGAEEKHEIKKLSPAVLQSRAKGKLQVRLRKRGNLPSDSLYRNPKYDTAFVETLMSADEDVFDVNGAFAGSYKSIAPAYRSAELIELFNAVDAAKDHKPSSRYIPRIKVAETVDVPPRVSHKMENRARRWMIDPEWLTQNQVYDVESRIVNSGKAWGDEEDPEVLVEKQKRVREEKAEMNQTKKLRLTKDVEGRAKKDKKKGKKKGKMSEKKAEKEKVASGSNVHVLDPALDGDAGKSSSEFNDSD